MQPEETPREGPGAVAREHSSEPTPGGAAERAMPAAAAGASGVERDGVAVVVYPDNVLEARASE